MDCAAQSSGQTLEQAVLWKQLQLFNRVTDKKSSSMLIYQNKSEVINTEMVHIN